ncbi:hypothetical protein [Rhizobium sp. RCC_161_2]|uniref:hypothetical protein n=1 Tax=Rhizobium sp. RCC_161_2 TaxID=3239219 RepID=UPI00352624DF
MMASTRERWFWLGSLLALPLLILASFTIDSWRNIGEYRRRAELDVEPYKAGIPFAGAFWTLQQARLIGDGRDTQIKLPNDMRLVIIRLSAEAGEDIGQNWIMCNLTLTDDKNHRWQHLDAIMSSDLSRELDRSAEPVDGCDAVSRHPPEKGHTLTIEEKFIVPAQAASSLAAQLSFLSTRPDALSIPLNLK